MSAPPPTAVAAPWHLRAGDLAAWAWRVLVNRTDVWGGYLPPDLRKTKKRADGTTFIERNLTKPAKRKRGKVLLAETVIERHFKARNGGDVIGLHSTGPDNLSRWLCLDIDQHAEGDTPQEALDKNWRAALHWWNKLRLLGFRPVLEDADGKGGFHVWVVFAAPVRTPDVFHFGRWLVSDFFSVGYEQAPETFPKQPGVAADSGIEYGNWTRLFGLHHTQPHWSRIWDGGRWLEGADAVAALVAIAGDDRNLMPADAIVPPAPPTPKPQPLPQAAPAEGDDRFTDEQVALAALAAIPNPDLHYDQWIRVGAALHGAGGGRLLLDAWIAWSRGSAKYTDGECEGKWETFRRSNGTVATVGTLVHLAREAGADPYAKLLDERTARREREGVESQFQRGAIGDVPISLEASASPAPTMPGTAKEAFRLGVDAQPPFSKLMKLNLQDRRCLETYYRHRTDLKDTSPAGYDAALAPMLAKAGWSDQEIVDTLIGAHVEAKEDVGLVREYYEKVIEKARDSIRQAVATAFLDECDPAEMLKGDAARKAELLRAVSDAMGVRISRLVKYQKDPPEYFLATENGEIELGNVSGLINQAKFRESMAAAQDKLIPTFKTEKWNAIAQFLLNLCEVEEVGPEGTDKGIMKGWLGLYLDRYSPEQLEESVFYARKPFYREGLIAIFGDHFRTFVDRKFHEKLTSKHMGKLLTKCGATCKVMSPTFNGTQKCRMVWLLPLVPREIKDEEGKV